MRIGTLAQDVVEVQWKIEGFTSLKMDAYHYWSRDFPFAGGEWCLCIRRVNPDDGRIGQRIELLLRRWTTVGPLTLDVEYTFSVKERNGHRHGEKRQRMEFTGFGDGSRRIPIEMEEEKMSDLVPGDTLTVLCQVELVDPMRGTEAAQLKEELQQKTGELASVRRELAEKQTELVRLRRLNEELNLKVTDLQANRDNAQKLFQTKLEAQFKKELEEKMAELDSVKRGLGNENIELKHQIQELTRKVIDIEASTEKLQSLLTETTQLMKVLEQKAAELDSVKKELEDESFELKYQNEELTRALTDTEAIRKKLQSLLTSSTEKETSTVDNESEVAAAIEPESSGFSETENKKSASNVGDTEEYDFTQDFNRFLEERRGTDVTFVSETLDGREEIFAHRLILAMRSPYFADEFYGEQRRKESTVVILINVDQKPFKDMIRYCYGWEPRLRTTEEASALLDTASQFKVIGLVNVCRTFLWNAEIEPGNVFSLLVVSEKTGDKSLRDRCNKLLQEKSEEVLKFHELCDVTPSMVRAILDLPKLSLGSEYELISWILEWANVKYAEKDSNCKNSRDYLENNLLKNLNFLALTLEEFAMLCTNNQDFFSSVEFQSISMNIARPGAVEMPEWYDKDLRFRAYTGLKE